MTKHTIKRVWTVYGILVSIMILIAGFCLMAACVEIYRSGDRPFSPQAVAESFSGIALPIYLCLALIAAGFILHFVLPMETKKPAVQKQHSLILRKLHEKHDLSTCAQAAAISTQQRSRKLHYTVSAGLLILGAVVFLIYGLNPNNYHQTQINDSMIRAMYFMLPCLAVPFGYAVFTAFYARSSMMKEIELVKQAIAGGCPKISTPLPTHPAQTGKQQILRWALLCAAVGILVYGFFAGGTADVLTKAVNICTECVGLG